MDGMLLFYALIGLGLGVIADKVLEAKSVGLILNLLLGAAGAVVGGYIVSTLHFTSANEGLTAAIVGAAALSLLALFLGFLFKRY